MWSFLISLVTREMQIKPTEPYHHTPTQMAKINKTIPNAGEGVDLSGSQQVGVYNGTTLQKMAVSNKIHHTPSWWPSNPTHRYAPRRNKVCIPINSCIRMFGTVLFPTAPDCKQPTYSSPKDGIRKLRRPGAEEYHSATRPRYAQQHQKVSNTLRRMQEADMKKDKLSESI